MASVTVHADEQGVVRLVMNGGENRVNKRFINMFSKCLDEVEELSTEKVRVLLLYSGILPTPQQFEHGTFLSRFLFRLIKA